MPLHSVAPQLETPSAPRLKSRPLPTHQKRSRLLALLRSTLPTKLSIVLPALGLMAVAAPAANAQYGIYTNAITDTDPSTVNPYINGEVFANGVSSSAGLLRGAGLTASSAQNRFSAANWTVGTLVTGNNDYFEWSLTPSSNYALDLSNISLTGQLSTGTATLSLRSSLDGFATNVSTVTSTTSASGNNSTLPLSSAFQNLNTNTATTYRIYGSDFAATSTTFSVNDFSFNGLVSIRWNGASNGNITGANYLGGFTAGPTNGLQFEGSANTAVNVDAATSLAGIRFAAGASPFTLSGSAITLTSAGGIANYSTNLQTINSNLVLTNPQITTINTAAGDITLSGVISSSGGSITLNKNGSGTLILGGSNTYTGVTNLNAGVTKIVTAISGATPFGPSSGSPTATFSLGAGATLDLNGATINAAGVTNGFRGTLTNTSATAASWTSNSISNSGSFTIDGIGNISLAAITGSVGNAIVKNGNNTLTLTGGIDNGNLAITVNNGIVVLGKGSTVSSHAVGAPLIINGGIARLGGSGGDQILNSAAATVTVVGGTFDVATFSETLTGTLQIGNGTLNGSVTGTTGILSNQATVNAQSGSAAAILSGTAGLTKTTAGTVSLSGANTYIGTTTVSAGTLQVASPNALGYGGTTGLGVTSAGTTVAAGATLDIAGQNTVAVKENITLNGNGVGGNGALINSSATASVIGGGVATLTLLTGGAGYGTTTPTATITGGGGTLATASVTRGVTANTWSFVTNGATYSVAPTVTITLGNGTGATAVANLDGTGAFTGITITNPGTGFTSNPTLTFTGGTLTSGATPTPTPNSTNFQISGITLTAGGSAFTSPPTVTISAGSSGTATASSSLPTMILGSTSSIGGTGDITVNSVVSESSAASGLTKVGSNTVTLTAANTYTGSTTVNAGTLKLTTSSSNNVATSSQITLGGGTLDVTTVSAGFALATGQILSGAGTVSGGMTAGTATEIRPGGTGVAGTLNFSALALNGASLTFDLGTTSDLMNLGANPLAGSGTNTFTLNSLAGFGSGTYTLIDYGILSGISLSNFALSSPTLSGFNVALADNGSAIVLNVTPGAGGANFVFTDTTAVTLNVLKGSTASATKTILNSGTATGTASLANTNSNLSVSGNLSGIAAAGTALQTLSPTSTAVNGTTTGTLTVTANSGGSNVINTTVNVGNASYAGPVSSAAFGTALSAATPISGTPYSGLSSTTVGLTSTGTTVPSLGTTATIFSYTNSSGTDTTVSMAWRSRTADEASNIPSLNDNGNKTVGYLLSDVVNITGMDNGNGFTDTFILQMNYNEALLDGHEPAGVNHGNIYIAWKTGSIWVNSILGNSTAASHYYPNQAYNASARVLGDYGIDPTNNVVWAVLDHNSEFAVIPEPSTMVAGGLALLGFVGVGLRRRRNRA
jgi:autotransporter-associated beta strand protein